MISIDLLNKISEQMDKCYERYGSYTSFSEAMAVLHEEHNELWQEHSKHELDFDRIEAEIIDNIVVLIKMYNDIVLKKNRR